ncbi:Ig-like domain-containing domain [Hymenobacter koreensis]|uniref:Ig-like domain-containing domain n=1 Tax=Hymenobacter koreensis TaxID=1084523 RepID=UPI0031E65C39
MSVRVNLLWCLPAGLWLAGCAAISAPEGGARDTIAPELVRSSPRNGATSVTQQSVRLEFSEQVQLKELSKNLLVTPSLAEDNPYKVRQERNSVELRFEKPLAANTTYVFNFRDAVTDITESNVAANTILTFSTGAALDSGSVAGTVTQLLTGLPAAEALIALYPAGDTADVRRQRPFYAGRTDKSGAFVLRNLREGPYRVYALFDKNQNSRFDEPEAIAYLPQPVQIRAGLDSVQLVMVRPDSRRPLVLSQKSTSAQFQVGYNEGLRQVAIAPLGQPATPAISAAVFLTEKGRTAAVQRTPALAAGRYLLSATDSAGNTGVDTVNVKFDGQQPNRRGPQYTVVDNAREVYRNGQLRFQFNEPVQLLPNRPFGVLVEDSTTRRPLRSPADGLLSPDRTLLTVNLNTKARGRITFIPDSAAILPVSGQALGLRPLRLAVTDQASTGSLAGTVKTTAKRFELQLLDQNYQIITSLISPRTFKFDNLAPGTYRLRVLVDADNDGRWRGGDPKLRLPAEPVFNFPQPQQVRANWDIENLQLAF